MRVAVFCGPILGAAILSLSSASSQQISPDQLQRLQQLGNDQNQNPSSTSGLQQPVILQPAVPAANQGALSLSRLEEIMSVRAGAPIRQFGYDQLGRAVQVTVPQTGAVDDDYILGPGDEIAVSLRGQENSEQRATVNRNGQIVLPRLAPVGAAGRSFGSVRTDIDSAVRRAYVATDASISVGHMRQISVLVTGEVNNPGLRLATGLSSAVDALLLSGGVRKTGSLRNVRIQRGGHEYVVDLYSILTGEGSSHIMRLADGDRIIVPHLGRTAAVTGLVRQPGIYELAPGQSSISARALLALAGGMEVRGRFRLDVLRVTPEGSSEMVTLPSQGAALGESDILFVQLGADQTVDRATLSGATGLAGSYPLATGTKLSDVLRAPGALGTSPYTLFGLIVRRQDRTLMPVLVPFSPVAILAGREDIVLKSDDVIRTFSSNEIQLLNFVVQTYIEGVAQQQAAIRNPLGQANGGANNTLSSTIQSQAGEVPEIADISSVSANVQRRQVNLVLNLPAPGSARAQQEDEALRTARARAALQTARTPAYMRTPGPQANPQDSSSYQAGAAQVPGAFGQGAPLPPNDSATAGNAQQQNQFSGGTAPNPPEGFGDVGGQDAARNFTEQSVREDGFASNREVQTFGQLARQIDVDPLVLINFLIDARVRVDGAVRGPGIYFAGPDVLLENLVEAAGGTIRWADESGVELVSTAVDQRTGRATTVRTTLSPGEGGLSNYVVREHDQFRFKQTFTDMNVGSVTIQGEVHAPGTFPINRGERLSDVLARAGGLTGVAYPNGTVFLRQSAAQVEQEGFRRAADDVQNQLVIAMTRVGNDKIEPNTFASMQTFVNELRNQKALGRISISADPSVLAANPALDPLMEPGDMVYIPQRPSTISVLGQVMQPGSYPYQSKRNVEDYIDQAGGYSSTADSGMTFVVLPDGTARRIEHSWLKLSADRLPPGSSIVVPRDTTPLDLRQTIIDVSQIFSQFAVAIASVAVLSKQ